MERGQTGDIAGRLAPAGLGTTTKCAEAGARGVEEHPVEPRLQTGFAAVGVAASVIGSRYLLAKKAATGAKPAKPASRPKAQ